MQRKLVFVFSATVFLPCSFSKAGTPVVPGFVVEQYATVPASGGLTLDSDRNLYAGNTTDGSPVFLRQVCRGSFAIEDYGDTGLTDPDPVIIDKTGAISGIAGSIITGGQFDGTHGYLAAISTQQQTSFLVASTTAFVNPTSFAFHADGRLLFADFTGQKVVSFDGSIAQTLFSTPASPFGIAVDGSGNIFVSTTDGTVLKYGPDGAILDSFFVTGLVGQIGLVFGPGSTAWGTDLYLISDTELIRVDSTGLATTIGTGFGSGFAITFGPDDALYVTGIWRIEPEVVELDLPVLEGRSISVYADVLAPGRLSFFDDGDLAAGTEINCDDVFVHRVSQTNAVVDYGNNALPDPDAVLVDTSGSHSGLVGAVLVGGKLATNEGYISAILPDQTIIFLFGPTTNFRNPSDLIEDSTGRLLIADFDGGVFVSEGGAFPTLLFSTGTQLTSIAVDANDRIYSCGRDGIIQVHESNGTLFDSEFTSTAMRPFAPLAFAPSCSLLDGVLFSIDADAQLVAIASDGGITVIGTNFRYGLADIEFNSSCDLFVSQTGRDRIVQISGLGNAIPAASTWGLLVMALLMLTIGSLVLIHHHRGKPSLRPYHAA